MSAKEGDSSKPVLQTLTATSVSSVQFSPLTDWVVEGTRGTLQQRSSSSPLFVPCFPSVKQGTNARVSSWSVYNKIAHTDRSAEETRTTPVSVQSLHCQHWSLQK